MRLPFLPLILGLVLLSFSTNAAPHGVKVHLEPTPANTMIAGASSFSSPIAATPTRKLSQTNPQGSDHGNFGIFYFESMTSPVGQFQTIEENSYNYNSASGSAAINSLDNLREEASSNQQEVFRQGMYYGFTFMIILLNLVCFFLFDDKVFLHYGIALTGLTVLFLFSDGLFSMFGWDMAANLKALQSSILVVAIACASWFAAKYLNLAEFYPKLKWVTAPLLLTAGMLSVMSWFMSDATDITNTANTLAYVVMTAYFVAGILLFGRKNYAKFYVIATAIPLLFAIDFFVLRSVGINFLFTQASHVKAAALVEMLVLTYAITYRMQAIKEEAIIRQTEMRIFLKRQEVMNRHGVEKLVEEVYLENLIMHYDLDGLEIKLLQYISEGKENAKIARKLKTTEAEVEELTKELYHKLEIGEHIQEDYRMLDTQPDYIYN